MIPGSVDIISAELNPADFAAHFNHTVHVSQGEMIVLEGGDTALVLAKTHVQANQGTDAAVNVERRATYVFRRLPDGKWRCVIDNSYGTDLLAMRLLVRYACPLSRAVIDPAMPRPVSLSYGIPHDISKLPRFAKPRPSGRNKWLFSAMAGVG